MKKFFELLFWYVLSNGTTWTIKECKKHIPRLAKKVENNEPINVTTKVLDSVFLYIEFNETFN